MQACVFGAEPPENDARRFLFLDSRYNDTNAHMVGIYIRYSLLIHDAGRPLSRPPALDLQKRSFTSGMQKQPLSPSRPIFS